MVSVSGDAFSDWDRQELRGSAPQSRPKVLSWRCLEGRNTGQTHRGIPLLVGQYRPVTPDTNRGSLCTIRGILASRTNIKEFCGLSRSTPGRRSGNREDLARVRIAIRTVSGGRPALDVSLAKSRLAF